MADVETRSRTREIFEARLSSALTQVDAAVEEVAAAVNSGAIGGAVLVELCSVQLALESAHARAAVPSAPLEAGHA